MVFARVGELVRERERERERERIKLFQKYMIDCGLGFNIQF